LPFGLAADFIHLRGEYPLKNRRAWQVLQNWWFF